MEHEAYFYRTLWAVILEGKDGAWFEGLTSVIAHRVVKRNYKVICFAEDRKDINGGDIE